MTKRWVLKDTADAVTVKELAAGLNINPVLSALLAQRGISNFDEAKYFFRPTELHLHDPFLMQDMEKAIERIEQAISSNEKILVYGDYDVDGTTAVALTYSFFEKIHKNIEYYIPDRYKEGYGISTMGIDYAAENGFSLIIALDCGIKSVDKIAYANTLGVDFIICDHHLPGAELPAAVAVLDPKRSDCGYPYKELSGAGIGFKLIQAWTEKNDLPFEGVAEYLDLVAISIACDIVHVTGENRVLAYLGLKKINENPCIGVKTLMQVAGRGSTYTISDVVFLLGPRINAAGRIDDAKHAVELLIACHEDAAKEKGDMINIRNTERKGHDQQITDEALSMIDNDEVMIARKSTVVFNEAWHKGVIGIVASRLTEKYYRPTVVLTRSNGHVAGSARSVLGYDLYEALCGCSDLLIQFGGHKYAAGLTMHPENVPAFIEKFEEVVGSTITDEQLIQQISIDAEIELKDIDSKFFRILSQFAPFGPENMSPVFLSKNVYVSGNAGLVGSAHVKMFVMQPGSAAFSSIAFNQGELLPQLKPGVPFDICYSIEKNVWREQRTIQLNIKGIIPTQPSPAGRALKSNIKSPLPGEIREGL
ncbi:MULTISPECIES: single-stranded-DNA-specific exonuclease RecJ [unclassified Mucilaginibacter]|uniref:single-stranded-DNA-specific exonuclease RecJ n=1 Tax=unclassified Mucilaginibacter TaxID=2617802 RepID=UPI002AC99135|nr:MULTISPECIES: single-stranded-DNA-specific exonuclease RecJ [unclassified Mucilaginibacter]MEB0261085.1 single-stranded-DNA-specific exonuclease RecJ [Mucilaginibacter sp. 10I4]MEB0278758.1 single-stranded-DNA-specific exonuclease RecJ [Mucilaginibacter sp. 10B2]MEB0301708.1 single-stranded-DNA-specific exonuclease RecJ [Mucilaginibacter sp. 5C4]WPX23290.1 single-stranded-DNA-specific exonuclease RecJ [Mucilaginibacter sp. 5C4]